VEAVFESFQTDVLDASHEAPILVDFWAEWCGPCRSLGPILEKLEGTANGKWRLVKINVDEHQDIAQQFKVQGIPACKLFHKGEVIGEFTGALPEPEVKAFFDEHLPSEEKDQLVGAKAQIESGDTDGAKAGLEDILSRDPANTEAAVSLARLIFAEQPDRAASLVEAVALGDPLYDDADAIRTLGRLAGVTEAKDDHKGWSGYIEGNVALAQGDYAGALAAWIDTLAAGHREVDDDGPRRACIAMFKVLGEEDETTREYRRAFSSALF
jgi:putative thioredoxin